MIPTKFYNGFYCTPYTHTMEKSTFSGIVINYQQEITYKVPQSDIFKIDLVDIN